MKWEDDPHVQRIRANSFFGLPNAENDDESYAEAINKIRESMLIHKPQVQVLEEKTGHAVYNFFDDPTDIVEFINEHHIKKEDIVGIVRRDSVCLGSNLFRYYLIYFEEEE